MPPVSEADRRRARDQIDALAWLLDSSIPIPGIGRIGVDALIGLVPGVGDATSALLAAFIILRGVQIGVPRIVLVRMVLNAGIDLVVGAIPVAGDLFDAWFKANQRNAGLVRRYATEPGAATTGSWIGVATILGAVLLVVVGVIAGTIFAIGAIAGALS